MKRASREGGGVVWVAVVTRRKDLELFKRRRWYRVPVGRMPRRPIEFIALYQTARFGKGEHGIRYYARVKSFERARRVTLLPDERDHPRAANLYVKINVGKVRRLPHLIRHEPYLRVNFFYTTRALLLKARRVNSLLMRTPIEAVMARLLKKKRIRALPQFHVMMGDRWFVADFAILCRRGRIDLECDSRTSHSGYRKILRDRERDNLFTSYGWSVLRFPDEMIFHRPGECIAILRRTIALLGGIKLGH